MLGTWKNKKGGFNHLIVEEGAYSVVTACNRLHEKDEYQGELASQPKCLSCWNRRFGMLEGEDEMPMAGFLKNSLTNGQS